MIADNKTFSENKRCVCAFISALRPHLDSFYTFDGVNLIVSGRGSGKDWCQNLEKVLKKEKLVFVFEFSLKFGLYVDFMSGKKEKDKLECPFCGDENIKVNKIQKFKPSSRGFGRDFKIKMISNECSNCGKENPELKKKLKKKGFPIR